MTCFVDRLIHARRPDEAGILEAFLVDLPDDNPGLHPSLRDVTFFQNTQIANDVNKYQLIPGFLPVR